MTLLGKIRWIASILLIFSIVLITNLIDKNNFNDLSDSVTTIYEDRIVASDLLFDLSRLMHKKEIAIISAETTLDRSESKALDLELEVLLDRYRQTKLTRTENIVFKQLEKEFENINILEEKTERSPNSELENIQRINGLLHELSKIQLQESSRQVHISNKAKDRINLFSQVEFIFLIIMAVMVQIIILYEPKKSL